MAKKKIDPLNKKQYGAVSAMLTVSDIPAAMSFYQKAFGFSKRAVMNSPHHLASCLLFAAPGRPGAGA
jgi:predicted enzyme related to lactoylglutathione lyase